MKTVFISLFAIGLLLGCEQEKAAESAGPAPLPPVEDIGDLDQSPEPAPGGDTGPIEDGGTGNCETANFGGKSSQEAIDDYNKQIFECVDGGNYYNISNGGCDSSITLVACDEESIRADLQGNDLSNFNSLITRNAGYNALACIERQDGGKEYITYSPLSCSSGKLNLKMDCIFVGSDQNSETCPKL